MAHRVMTFLVVLALAALAPAQTFTTLYSFTGGSDGASAFGGVIQDPSGNLYGTTQYGGAFRSGVVYEISTAGTETVLHSFDDNGKDGDLPVTSLLRDSKGNFYGTTLFGGYDDWGTVFKIDTAGKETVLHSFGSSKDDGCLPNQGLVMGKSSIVFGTTNQCGSHNRGTIFKVDGARNFSLLYGFIQSPYGGRPGGGHLTRDRSGNLYGVTEGGGHNAGALYKLAGSGAPSLLHSFKRGTKDGCIPFGSVVRDNSGSLYGTTYDCGSNSYGTIWKVRQKGKETILHNFAGGTSDGCNPYAGVTIGSEGNLYGVTSGCGAYGYGVLYELSASGTFTLLHSFDDSDGALPYGEVLWTANGTLFGTTEEGGTYDYGTVWSYVP